MSKYIFLTLALLVFAGAGCAATAPTTNETANDATNTTEDVITGTGGDVSASVTIIPAEDE